MLAVNTFDEDYFDNYNEPDLRVQQSLWEVNAEEIDNASILKQVYYNHP